MVSLSHSCSILLVKTKKAPRMQPPVTNKLLNVKNKKFSEMLNDVKKIMSLTTFSFKTFNILILGSTCQGPYARAISV